MEAEGSGSVSDSGSDSGADSVSDCVSDSTDPQLDWKPDERGKGLATKRDNTHRHNNKKPREVVLPVSLSDCHLLFSGFF